MTIFRARLALMNRLVILTMLLGMLWPIAQAWGMQAPASQGTAAAPWLEVCTTHGVEYVRMDGGMPSPLEAFEDVPAPAHAGMAHCLYCFLSDEALLALPPATATVAWLAAEAQASEWPPAARPWPRSPRRAWPASPPRAPPALF
ncbi:DUF2946 domain-containing protein [Corticibacter populi]|uniref:DUF2946 domain-containing protein n=1 Tax=Corticibacter populi TaxID=1550736 RepID=A0A3M6QYM2_9BURK|nr:DUF2946 family protein [Corticibacter populi]RMX08098.1 DUF2946 domain-containing protein [Corticibacter populi]RZS35347.1 DUF2946 family protein [Corticibacter populi]